MEINWIYWDGGLCPLKKGTKIDICHRGGEKFFNAEVGESVAEDWSHDGSTADIIAYRLTFMIDHSKTIEAMSLELDRVNAKNAALKASLSAPQAVGCDMKGFIKQIFSTYWENSCCDIYGEDIQTWGENFGILRAELYDPDAHGGHHILDWDAVPFESTIYVYSPEFKGAATVPRLSEQDVVTDKTPDTEHKDGSAYQAGRKQDAPTVEANSKALKAFNRYSMATMPFTLIEYLAISSALREAAK